MNHTTTVTNPPQHTMPSCPVCGGLECLCRPRFFAVQLLSSTRSLHHREKQAAQSLPARLGCGMRAGSSLPRMQRLGDHQTRLRSRSVRQRHHCLQRYSLRRVRGDQQVLRRQTQRLGVRANGRASTRLHGCRTILVHHVALSRVRIAWRHGVEIIEPIVWLWVWCERLPRGMRLRISQWQWPW